MFASLIIYYRYIMYIGQWYVKYESVQYFSSFTQYWQWSHMNIMTSKITGCAIRTIHRYIFAHCILRDLISQSVFSWRLSKPSRRRWFETPSRSLLRHCNEVSQYVDYRPRNNCKIWHRFTQLVMGLGSQSKINTFESSFECLFEVNLTIY